MNLTRRELTKGGLASLGFLMLGDTGLFAAPKEWTPRKAPNLVFGVISDTHMRTHYDGVSFYSHYENVLDDAAVRAVFKYFRGERVDAVVHCGDLTDRGIIRTVELYKKAWDSVFKGGKKPVHLYATGNHDVETGYNGWAAAIARSDNPDDYRKLCFGHNLKETMERLWGEPFEDVWHKTVKGYHFFGMGWGLSPDDLTPAYHGKLYRDSPMEGRSCSRFIHKGLWMSELVRREREAGRLDPSRPFFAVYHCSIPRYDGAGVIHGHLREALGLSSGAYCNGLGLFGHGHRSNADWYFFWNRGAAFPALECSSLAYWKDHGGEGEKPLFAQGVGDSTAEGGDRNMTHALLFRVYDDVTAIRRIWVETRPKTRLARLGPDLVVPLSGFTPGSHPLLSEHLVGSDEMPEFLRGAKLEVADIGDVLRLKIPKACGNARARVYGYNVEVSSPGNAVKLKKSVYANGYSCGDGCEPDRGVTVLSIPKSELPPGKTLAITVHPSSCLASKGKPVTAIFNTVTGAVR